jgi:hypothetical protein
MRTKTILAMVVLLLSAMTLLTFSSAREKKVSQAAKVKLTSEQTLPLRQQNALKKLNPNQAIQKSAVSLPTRQVKVSPNLTIKHAVKKN